jgi:hypothetical protein
MDNTQATVEAMGGTIVNQPQPEPIFHHDDPYYSLPRDYFEEGYGGGTTDYKIRKTNRFNSMYKKRPQSKHQK